MSNVILVIFTDKVINDFTVAEDVVVGVGPQSLKQAELLHCILDVRPVLRAVVRSPDDKGATPAPSLVVRVPRVFFTILHVIQVVNLEDD